jgi:serine/threonine protein phosphatase PrpC
MAGSARGPKHQFYGEPNQDSFVVLVGDSVAVIVVADGVGSAAHSAFGSRLASRRIAESLLARLDGVAEDALEIPTEMSAVIEEVNTALRNWSTSILYAPASVPSEGHAHSVSTTVMAAVIEMQAGELGRRVHLAAVGDSPCYTLGDGVWTLRTSITKDGEVLSHATSAIPTGEGQPARVELFDFHLSPTDKLVLMSDGIGTSLGSGKSEVGRWLAALLADQPNLHQWIDAITFDRLGEDDDKTLVVLYGVEGE